MPTVHRSGSKSAACLAVANQQMNLFTENPLALAKWTGVVSVFWASRVQLVHRRLTEMRQDINETKMTIKHVLKSEELAGLCLTEAQDQGIPPCEIPRNSESVREAALLLQSYERQISTLENALKVLPMD